MPQQTKISPISPGQLSLFDLKPKSIPLLPDPWTLPVDEVISKDYLLFSAEERAEKHC